MTDAERGDRSPAAGSCPGWSMRTATSGWGRTARSRLDEAIAQAETDRDVGALLLRDCGSPIDTRRLDDRDDLPRIIRAGRHLARPKRYIPGLAIEIETAELAGRGGEQARTGDGWVKLVGDWIDRGIGDLAPLWSDDVLEGGDRRRPRPRRAGHRARLRRGRAARTDQRGHRLHRARHRPDRGHSSQLMPDAAPRWCPTLINIENFPGIADRRGREVPDLRRPTCARCTRRADRRRRAGEAGVPIYAGTDAGGSLAHGRSPTRSVELVGAGIPQAEVIAQASWRGREWLGFSGLEEGAEADFIVYAEDPRRDLATLRSPQRILLRGAVVA